MSRRTETNGPTPLNEISVIDKSWKCAEANNGYLRASPTKTGAEESLLSSESPRKASTVVQVSGTGTRTMVLPKQKPAKEKCLFASVLALIIFCSILTIMVINGKQKECGGIKPAVCLTTECVRTGLMDYSAKLKSELSEKDISEELLNTTKSEIKLLTGGTLEIGVRSYRVACTASLLTGMDRTQDPCVDFFQYACGAWNRLHIIPEDRSSISTFEVMADQLQLILKGVLEEPIHLEDNDAIRKAKTFYNSCMDIFQIRRVGDEPLRRILRDLGGWPVATENWTVPVLSIEKLLAKIRRSYNEGSVIEQWVGPDDKNSSTNVIQMDQMSLALPSRDYYLKPNSEEHLKAYHTYMTNIAVLLGANKTTAGDELEKVVEFEKRLANASLAEQDRHDTSAIYKKVSIRQLQKYVPQINWLENFRSFLDVPIDENEPVVVYGLSYFIEMGKILAETDRRIVHNYIMWRLVMFLSGHMIDEYQRERVEFRKILQGVLSERHRWSQCVEWTNKKLGMAVGALFIRDNFNHESKETALEMIHNIREAFNELLSENDWMDDETRSVAREKANAINERIGYPQMITKKDELEKEYAGLNISKKEFMKNVLSILEFEATQSFNKLRQPVDKNKWSTEPAVVNAFYNPNKNDIVFPAGILQPLFYSQHFPKSLNYGGIGVVIGHEITHGFDDKGRQFDKEGNMMQWWHNATIKAFRERTQCIIDQYSRYKIDEVGLYVNGRMTLGENIADNGGLKQSFRAYRKWVNHHGEEPSLPGLNLTHDQLFFLNYAQIWCGSMRPEDALTKVRSSVHSPGPVRVLGPLSNSWDFARAYQCPLGSPMNPTNKCSVW